MQLHTLLQFRPHLSNDESSQSTILSNFPLQARSQFPKEASVSLILVFLSVILLVLGIEASLHAKILLANASKIPSMTWMWLLAYCLANFLFVIHVLMYFTFHETISIEKNALKIEQNLSGIQSLTLIPISSILCVSLSEGTLGTKHIAVLWQDKHYRTKNLLIGSCLTREHIQSVTKQLKQMVLKSEDLAA